MNVQRPQTGLYYVSLLLHNGQLFHGLESTFEEAIQLVGAFYINTLWIIEGATIFNDASKVGLERIDRLVIVRFHSIIHSFQIYIGVNMRELHT